MLNIGGVANITYIDGADTLIACDTGPGNALLDDFMFRTHRASRSTARAALAAQGSVDVDWLARALQHPFFAQPPPKSLDRNDFAALGAAGSVAAGRRRDADRLHRGGDRADRAAAAEAAARAGSSPAAAPAI